MLPRTGFLVESRSCPVIGPGLGKAESKRFSTLQRQGPESIGYDLPPVQVYKNVGSNPTPKLGPGFGQTTRPRPNLFTPPCSPDKFYERRPATPKPAPRLGPGLGRPMSPRTCTLVPPGCGSDALYDLPSPEVYKQRREPGVSRWDPRYARFPKEHRFPTDQQYTLPSTDVYLKTGAACTTRLGPGPGLPSSAYGPRTAPLSSPQGADALYSLPSLSVTKSTASLVTRRFGAPVVRHEVGARRAEVPVRIPSRTPPKWLDRLSEYRPRSRAPWLEPR